MNSTTKETVPAKEVATPKALMNSVTQILLPTFTVGGFLLTALKLPEYGVVSNLVAQIFWFYAAWKAWKQAGQIGILVTTVLITISLLIGIVNYWILS